MDMDNSPLCQRYAPWAAQAALLALVFVFVGPLVVRAQETPQGPLAPPPEHNVRRIPNEAQPETPPALPAEEIIKHFSQKEDEYLAARVRYGYRKTIRIDEFGPDGKPSGQFSMVTEAMRASDGRVFEKKVEQPQSSLHYLELDPEDLATLMRIPAYPLTTSQLVKYDLKYVGNEQVDEIDCYIFQVKPKTLERARALFEGVVWVDSKYLEVVKTYGKWVTELGDMHSPTLPFSMFETYRENVDGKYWLPNYSRSDGTLHLKELGIPIRIIIKWTDFKPFPGAAPAPPTAPAKPQS
jgi:hypothetical protein